ncbi:L-gulonolactone oxidase [Lamellibrachia satsuma]|nr:L-gulonolactone oxidase [Lamellibrachia satsuma]
MQRLNLDIGETGHVFSNWAATYSCRPELYFEPSSTDELRQILAAARTNRKKVRVVGNGCSLSDLVCTTDYLVSMRRFDKILQVDKKNCTVVVESGVMVSDLNEILADNGLALSVSTPCGVRVLLEVSPVDQQQHPVWCESTAGSVSLWINSSTPCGGEGEYCWKCLLWINSSTPCGVRVLLEVSPVDQQQHPVWCESTAGSVSCGSTAAPRVV